MADIRLEGTKDLIRYWVSISMGPYAPLRADVSPRAIQSLLPRVFILSNESGVWRFKLAGTDFYYLYGRELTGLSFSSIWGADFELVARGLDDSATACLPAIISSDAWSSEGVVQAETVLLPLRSSPYHADVDRFIGFQSYSGECPWWLSSRSFIQASVGSVELVGGLARDARTVARGQKLPAIRTVEKSTKIRIVETEAR
jgi:hypothetical protein